MEDIDQGASETKGAKAPKPQRTVAEIDERMAAIDAAMLAGTSDRKAMLARFSGSAKIAAKRLDALATFHCNLAVAFVVAGLIANYAIGGPGSGSTLAVSLFNALVHILSGMLWLGLQEDSGS